MKFLPPQRLRPAYYADVAEQLRDVFWQIVYAPVVAILQAATGQAAGLENAEVNRALQLALRRGEIQYKDGVFTGAFEAATSGPLRDLGADFDLRAGVFRLPEWAVPAWVKAEAALAQAKAARVHAALTRQLEATKARLGELKFELDPTEPVAAIEAGFQTTAEALGVETSLPPAARARMEKRYVEQVRPYVSEATAGFIDDLHAAVSDNAAGGYRYDHLVAEIEAQAGVSRRKARFLARQETSLFMAAYRQERFAASGVRRYKWSNSHDARVRPAPSLTPAQKRHAGDHRVLDGKIFYYTTKAPAQFMSSRKPCNPGEDFQCRCVDLPVLEALAA